MKEAVCRASQSEYTSGSSHLFTAVFSSPAHLQTPTNHMVMSQQSSRVASLLLEETFGEVVKRVGAYLVRHGALTLSEIARGTGLKTAEVSKI